MIWLAGIPGGGWIKRERVLNELWDYRLWSYFYWRNENIMPDKKVKLFLDSGAFSAFTQNINIDIQAYIEFIKKYESYLEVYANLDVIGDAEGSLKNQRTMEKAGLNPLPCFHYGEPVKYLEQYIKENDYIALGGMVPISTKDLTGWLDDLFNNHLTNNKGLPKVKVHGFGLTSFRLMKRYPWYSVDSTSWVVTGRMGSVYVPKHRQGKWDYGQDCWKVTVSSRSPSKGEAGQHIDTFPPKQKQIILDYFKHKGYELGKSKFVIKDEDYKPKDNERWNGKAGGGRRELEIVEKAGLSNDYKLRDELNIIYFLDLEKSFQKWPWAMKLKPQGGFGI